MTQQAFFEITERTCLRCNKLQPKREFYVRTPEGKITSWCRTCSRESADEWRRNNPEKFRAGTRKRLLRDKYGMTPEQYETMLESQDGKCAACGTSETGERNYHFSVDHDHATGFVRGLLYSPCNLALGIIGESADALRGLAEYAEERCGNDPVVPPITTPRNGALQ